MSTGQVRLHLTHFIYLKLSGRSYVHGENQMVDHQKVVVKFDFRWQEHHKVRPVRGGLTLSAVIMGSLRVSDFIQ